MIGLRKLLELFKLTRARISACTRDGSMSASNGVYEVPALLITETRHHSHVCCAFTAHQINTSLSCGASRLLCHPLGADAPVSRSVSLDTSMHSLIAA